MNSPINIKQEINERGQHRLVHKDGRSTAWAHYQSFTFLDGYVGYTAFYGEREGVCTADEFCRMVGIG